MSGPLPSLRADYSPHARVTPSLPAMRRYYTMSLAISGRAEEAEVSAPANAEFESAFNALAHGSLITTTQGEVAIEDLRPGMDVVTRERGAQKVMWIGLMTHMPNDNPQGTPLLTRVTSDRFGGGCPSPDLLAGPGARMLHRPAGVQYETPGKLAYSPLRDFIDGDGIIGLNPREPVDTYHICLRRHATIRANGLDLEAFHPGTSIRDRMGTHTLELFMSMFPHIRTTSDFGSPAHPRLSLRGMEGSDAA